LGAVFPHHQQQQQQVTRASPSTLAIMDTASMSVKDLGATAHELHCVVGRKKGKVSYGSKDFTIDSPFISNI